MASKYLDVLHRRNTLTWMWSITAALVINAVLFILMSMLQTGYTKPSSIQEIVPDVTLVEFRHQEREKQKFPEEKKVERLPEPVQVPVERPVNMGHRNLEFPIHVDPGFQPVMEGLGELPVAMGFDVPLEPDGIFSVGDLDAPVSLEVRVPPVYPIRARERRIEGWVKIKLLVDQAGRVDHVQIIEAKPPGYFEHSVLQCVRKWKFTPPAVSRRPVKVWMVTKIRFQLED